MLYIIILAKQQLYNHFFQSVIKNYFIHWKPEDYTEKVEPSEEGYWLFDPPKLLNDFFITIQLEEGQKVKLEQVLSEIEVLKPCEFL